MKTISSSLLLLCVFIGAFAQPKEVKIKLIHTTDVHGNFFSYDFVSNRPFDSGLARVSTYVNKQRKQYQDKVLLLDGGDLLQGQPTVYYYNYLDTIAPHVGADVMNYLKYDALVAGNHDIETGHPVYDRWVKECKMPVLGANVLRKEGSPYLKPYQIFVIDGVKIAVLGLTTSAIPVFLPTKLWEGLAFADMEQTARKWMKVIKQTEKPDVIVGLFHSGVYASTINGKFRENASLEVARRVPGFDVVLSGHDHTEFCKKVVNTQGDSVLIINPANNAKCVSSVNIDVQKEHGKVVSKSIRGKLPSMKYYTPDSAFMSHFALQNNKIKDFVNRKIGYNQNDVKSQDAYFGSSAFIDFVHQMQLEISGADISFTAPLSYNYNILKSDLYVRDMFKLYSYENMLCCMSLKGSEVRAFLEESYSKWINQMKTPTDHLLQIAPREDGHGYGLRNFGYNFDSAAGIIYTVDVTKNYGSRVKIISMADGSAFDANKMYKVAVNSYRANGGGELLTKGAGIPVDQLKNRITTTYPKDLRYYLMKMIEKKGTINPQALHQWKFIPTEWTVPAAAMDRELLFNAKDLK